MRQYIALIIYAIGTVIILIANKVGGKKFRDAYKLKNELQKQI